MTNQVNLDRFQKHVLRQRIVEEEAKRTGVTAAAILGNSRRSEIVEARWCVWARWSMEIGMGLSEIARHANRDHTTILHAMRQMGVEYSSGTPQAKTNEYLRRTRPLTDAAVTPRGWTLQAAR